MRVQWIKKTLKTQLTAISVSVSCAMTKYSTIVIFQVNTEVQLITNVTCISGYVDISLYSFII